MELEFLDGLLVVVESNHDRSSEVGNRSFRSLFSLASGLISDIDNYSSSSLLKFSPRVAPASCLLLLLHAILQNH